MNQPPGPPYGPPPGGPPPYGPQPSSRLRPPWREAGPGERGTIILWTVIGFVLPWLLLAAGIVLAFLGYPGPTFAVLAATVLLDVAGFVVMMVANRMPVRGAAYGSFIGCLTHAISAAIAVVVFFGWCVSMLAGSH